MMNKQNAVQDLAGKVVFITGGASGIGEASAELFAEHGASVVVADLDRVKGAALVERLGPKHRFVHLDVTDEEAWPKVLRDIVSDLGRLDLLFLNAGVMSRPQGANILDDPLDWLTRKAFDKNFAVNVLGAMFGIRAAIPFMQGRHQATIMITASGAGLRGYPQDVAYSVSKAGAVFLASCMATLLTDKGIRVMSISPHGIDTPMCPPDLYEKKKSEGSFSSPRDMAEAVLHVYQHGKSGETWGGGHQQAPWLHAAADFIPVGQAGPKSH